MTEIALRDMHPDEGPVLEARQLRASLVWEQYRADLEAHPEAVAPPAGAIVRVAPGARGAPPGVSGLLAAARQTRELGGPFVEPPPPHPRGRPRPNPAPRAPAARRRGGGGGGWSAAAGGGGRGGGAWCGGGAAGRAPAFSGGVGLVFVGETEPQSAPAVTLRRAL